MKRQILLLLLIFNLSVYGQTKKETIDWLNSKFEGSPIVDAGTMPFTRFLKIDQDGSFSCQQYDYSLNIVIPTTENYFSKCLFTGNFKDLSPNSITTKTIDGKIFFYATCSSGKCITQKSQGPHSYNTYLLSSVLLGITSDTEIEARCKKAFIHLITLCGGKKEAF